jgi:hypothetical protein
MPDFNTLEEKYMNEKDNALVPALAAGRFATIFYNFREA